MSAVALAPEFVAPAHLWVPEHASSESGREAIDLAGSLGMVLDPEQELAVESILAERPDGRWAAFEAALVASRQNLKTFVFRVVVLGDLCLFDTEMVTWTAHEFNTAMEAFRDFNLLIEEHPFLSRRVKKINETNGKEGVEFHSGQRLRFRARTKTGGRGLTGDRVILDEAFALQPAHMGALMPTMSAKSMTGNPQILYGSSAGMVGSGVLRSIRDRGRRGDDPSLAYLEWCAAEGDCGADKCDHAFGAPECLLDDRERWRAANPAMGRRISEEHIEKERRSMPPVEFARERLGWWEDPVEGELGISDELWASRADRTAAPTEPVVLGLDVAPGASASALVACGDVLHVDRSEAGTRWVAKRVAELVGSKQVSAVVLEKAGPAATLIQDLVRPVAEGGAGLSERSKSNPDGLLVLLDGPEMHQACGGFLAGVVEGGLVHRDQGALNAAVAGAAQRKSGDAWRWSRRDSSSNIAPLVAATVARFVWAASDGSSDSVYDDRGLVTL